MARVFLSYRHVDGPFGVGWIAERLKSLDEVSDVQTTFHDASLRAGDDFPDALEAEIKSCDLVLAVIGPNWLGLSDHETARIQDPDDWVVREIDTALRLERRVMPVLMGGAEHPLASQLHPSIAELSRLHAIPYRDRRDLDTVVEQVRSHLIEIDRLKAARAKLDKPIEVPRLDHTAVVVTLAILVGEVGAVLAAAAAGPPSLTPDWLSVCGGAAACPASEAGAAGWVLALLILLGAFLGATSLVSVALSKRLVAISRLRWSSSLALAGLSAGGAAVAFLSLDADPFWSRASINHGAERSIATFAVAILLLTPTMIAVSSATLAEPTGHRYELAKRVNFLGVVDDAERWGRFLISVAMALTVALMASTARLKDAVIAAKIDEAVAATGTVNSELAASLTGIEVYRPVAIIAFALALSTILVVGHLMSTSKLREFRIVLDRDIAELPPAYRSNATPQLMTSRYLSGWVMWAIMALPAVTAIAIVIAI